MKMNGWVISSWMLLATFAAAAGNEAAEFHSLFNGKDLAGWVVVETEPGKWHVQDGELVIDKAHGGWIRTDREYADFVLKLEFNLTPGGNSGVFIRAPEKGNGAFAGMEIQMLDHFHEQYQQPGNGPGCLPRSAQLHPVKYSSEDFSFV